jgi:2-C-methyl-D-erythritol 4-phosphate cytidylyltransferase
MPAGPQMTSKVVALVPAAGRGLRMGGAIAKQFLSLAGQPLIVHTLRMLHSSPVIEEIILAVPQPDRQYCLDHIVIPHGFTKVTKIVSGGQQRQDSVRHALTEVRTGTEIVLVHDAVRPFLTEEMIERVVDQARVHGAAIVALPMRDTVKQVTTEGFVERTVDRSRLWLAQTPQAFRRDWLEEAHSKARTNQTHATDDAHLVELLGRPVMIVEGSGENIKVTTPEDLVVGEAILAARPEWHRSRV